MQHVDAAQLLCQVRAPAPRRREAQAPATDLLAFALKHPRVLAGQGAAARLWGQQLRPEKTAPPCVC